MLRSSVQFLQFRCERNGEVSWRTSDLHKEVVPDPFNGCNNIIRTKRLPLLVRPLCPQDISRLLQDPRARKWSSFTVKIKQVCLIIVTRL